MGLIWAEGGRKWVVSMRGGASMAASDGDLIPAEKRHGRARGEVEEVEGEVERLGTRGIEARWRWMAVAADGGEARLLCSLLRDGGEREGKTDTTPGEGIRTACERDRRGSPTADAWRRRRRRGVAVWACVRLHWRTQ